MKDKRPSDNDEDFDFFDLDQKRIDQEWRNQVKKVIEYGTQLADARRTHEKAKASLDLIEADLDTAIRFTDSVEQQKEPPKGKTKKKAMTEGAIKNAIIIHKKYQYAKEKLINAKYEVDRLQVVMDALEHRKKALESLVQLWSREYYAEPRAPEGTSEKVKDMRKDAAFRRKER